MLRNGGTPIVVLFQRRATLLILLFAAALKIARADFLEEIDRKLTFTAFNNSVHLRISGTFDLESYYVDQPPPGLIFTDDNFLTNPRLTLFLDTQIGSYISSFVQVRLDRAFDPSNQGAQIRLDEYAVRVSPWKNVALSLEAGKFATVVGNWVPRHYPWDNPFINAPLPYENLTGVWDSTAPDSVDTLLYWGHVPYDGINSFGDGYSDKHLRLPVIWGPSYASGFAVMGSAGSFDYAAELKNASLSSRPESWDLTQVGLSHPTFSGRVGFRPSEMWNVGFSASAGPYFGPEAASTLPPDRGIGDYREILFGQDVSFAWHHLQLWAEVFESRFEVPNVGNADILSYYIEAKYKLTPQLFTALRWNQQLFGTVGRDGDQVQWGNDTIRVDAAVGYRVTEYLQIKVQYSFTHQDNLAQEGEQFVASQITFKF